MRPPGLRLRDDHGRVSMHVKPSKIQDWPPEKCSRHAVRLVRILWSGDSERRWVIQEVRVWFLGEGESEGCWELRNCLLGKKDGDGREGIMEECW